MGTDRRKSLEVHPVTPDRWGDLVELFERPGPRGGTPIPGNCWCSAWRGREPTIAARKQVLCDLVESDCQPGLLAYQEGVPVGWVAVAPRRDHVIPRSRLFPPLDDDEQVFSITCFYIDPRARDDGVSSALLDAAIQYARARGAAIVEAYPKAGIPQHTEAGGRAEQTDSFMGRIGSYERRGFTAQRKAGARSVVRLDLDLDLD